MHATCYSERVNKKPLGLKKNQIFRYEKICLSYASLSSWQLSLLVCSLARAFFLIKHSSGCGYTSLRLGNFRAISICTSVVSHSGCGWLAMNFLSVPQLVISPLPTPHSPPRQTTSPASAWVCAPVLPGSRAFRVLSILELGWSAHITWLLVVVGCCCCCCCCCSFPTVGLCPCCSSLELPSPDSA